uniref:Uncharacterized protein n=1 Tax=Rhizophora mucronata TaxID=61149 RepID=A0A2P2LT28_RHIMU
MNKVRFTSQVLGVGVSPQSQKKVLVLVF